MLPKIINMFAVCPLCANPAQGKSFWRTDLMVCCCLFNYIVCNPAVVSRWTQVVILQLTSRPSESKLKPVGFFVTLPCCPCREWLITFTQHLCPQGLQGHKPHLRSHIWSKRSQSEQRHLWHSSLSRGVLASVLCPHVYQTPGLSLHLWKNSQRALCDQCWRVIPSPGSALFCSPCWGGWECPFHGERLSGVILGISSAWTAWDTKAAVFCSCIVSTRRYLRSPFRTHVLWNYS